MDPVFVHTLERQTELPLSSFESLERNIAEKKFPTKNSSQRCPFSLFEASRPGEDQDEKTLTLDEFMTKLPAVIDKSKGCLKKSSCLGTDEDPVLSIFRRLRLSDTEIEEFGFFDPSTSYTRNLIATDNERYTLLLMCWNPGCESPIHDHPCDGCWMRILQGSVNEVRYWKDANGDKLQCFSDETYHEGEIAYISDTIGLHKIGNPSPTSTISVHLYCPPFQSCRIWLNPECATETGRREIGFHSEYGTLSSALTRPI